MKTAIQELIEWTNKYEGQIISADQVVLKAYELLGKEKEQIMDAFKIGVTEGLAIETNSLGYDANEKTYYNKTYNQNK